MYVFNLEAEQEFTPQRHFEKLLGRMPDGDFSVACWEPGQSSTYHAHPQATEIYFCFRGGGQMRTPDQTVRMTPGTFVVHPPGELHEFSNGPERSLLFRVRFGSDMTARQLEWKGHPEWQPKPEDLAYFGRHSPGQPLVDPAPGRNGV